jgi:microcystin-dependent protein
MAFEYTQKYTVDSAPTNLTDLRVDNLLATGIVSATTFIGNGSGLLGLAGVGSGVIVRSSGSLIGVASTLNFATNLNVTPISAGIVTISLPSSLTGPISVAGTVTATKFSGDGSGLTGVTAVGSGVVLQNNGSPVGAAATLNFSTGLTVSTVSAGIATISTISSEIVGSVISVAYSTAPTGYLKANGAAISRSTYSTLFTAIGTTFGVGDGSTTFNVPDLRGEFVRGWDDSRGVDSGRGFGSFQADDFKSHTHTVAIAISRNPAIQNTAGGSTLGGSGSITSSSVGGTETRPRNIALLYCIKF